MCVPAVVNAISLATHGGQVVKYDTYVFQLRVLVMIIFVAAQAPELVSRDLRSHVLPLYFSRPLRRLDYPAAKLGAFILACLALLDIPLLLLYLGAITQAHSGAAVWDQTRALIPGLLVGLAWAVLLASIGLALASLSGRRAYATGSIAICFFLSWALAGLLRGVTSENGAGAGAGARLSGLVSPFTVLDGRAPVARRHLTGAEPAAGELRAALRPDVPADAGGRGGRAGRPVPEGGRGMSEPGGETSMSTIELRNVSRWYGNVVAINDITMTIGPGVTGLLGPNGAGKSTLLHLISGFLEPSRGELTVGGTASWRNPGIYRTLGLVPERPAVYPFLTGLEFVRATARLHKLADPDRSAERAIAIVEMAGAQDRKISTYSKGMRQRIKVAAALVHDPQMLLLDEPFNGMDPRQRLHMMDLLETLGDEGRTILFSSHILEEVERLSGTIQVIVAGRLAASGDFRAIRRLMTSRPHMFLVRTSDDRRLGAALIGRPSVTGVEMSGRGLQVKASDYGAFSREIAGLTREQGIQLRELLPEDESLESVFAYLVEQ